MKRKGIIWLVVLTCIVLCAMSAGCDIIDIAGIIGNSNENQQQPPPPISPPPTIYETKAPFNLGELITPTDRNPYWRIEYGEFPVMMTSPAYADFANSFARIHLDFPGRDEMEPYILDADRSYAMACFIGDGVFGSYSYDTNQNVRFDDDAELNLLLLMDFSSDDRAYLESKGGRIVAMEIAKSAVVFVTPMDNPVDGLTFEQLKGILSGEIKDWQHVGGAGLPIGLYYESQLGDEMEAVLKSRVLFGGRLAEPVLEEKTVGVGIALGENTILVRVPYENAAGSILVTSLREALDMDGIKILDVDGVKPDAESITSGEYPVTFGCFAVFWENDKEGTPGRFAEWMLSPEGRALIEESGFTPVID